MITLLLLLGIGTFFHMILKVSPEEGWATGLMTVMSLIFLVGLFGDTRVALVILYGIGIVGIICGGVAAVRHSRYSVISFFTPSIVMVLGVVAIGVVAFHGMHICNWDELFQWGKAANYMVLNDRFPNGEDFSGQNLLLSTTTIFHYFIARIGAWKIGAVTESDYYVSNLLLWFSAIILPFSGEGWRSWKKVWSFGLLQFLFAAIVFVQPYYNIYTDQATAYWAGALIAWLLLKKNNRKNGYLVPFILLNVGLMKSMVGPLFGVIVVVAMVVIYCSDCSFEGKPVMKFNWKEVLVPGKIFLGIFTLVTPVLYTVIWSFIVKKNAVYRGSSVTSAVEGERFKLTCKAMLEKVFVSLNMQSDSLYLSYGTFFIITLLVVFVLYPVIVEGQAQKRFQNLIYVYLLGFAGFFLVMLYAYLKVFGYTDSVRAMSLERYFSDYVMLGIIPLTIPLFLKLQREQTKHVSLLKRFVVMFAVLVIVYGSSGYILPRLSHVYAVDTENYKEREKFVSYAKQVKKYTNETGKIYFINQGKTGLFTLVADYELGDQLTREGMCFNFRKDTSEPVNGLTEYDIDTLPEVLAEEGYDYLWVYSTNDYFNENMQELFGLKTVKNGNFYRVNCDGDEVDLEYLGRVK
jgi:hypothetical protein